MLFLLLKKNTTEFYLYDMFFYARRAFHTCNTLCRAEPCQKLLLIPVHVLFSTGNSFI